MKFLFTFLLLIPFAVLAQSPDPVKQANTILITNESLGVDEAFKLVGQTLIDAGYTLDRTDDKFHTIQTNNKLFIAKIGRPSVSIILRSSIKSLGPKGVEIKLSGIWATETDKEPAISITYRGMKGSPFMVAFGHLDQAGKAIAKSVDGAITYTIQ